MSAISPRFVGNAFVPLLRTVPIERTTFVHKHVELAKTQYLPVAYTDSEVAEVHECSDRWKTVCNNGGKMIANFYFKKYTGKLKPLCSFEASHFCLTPTNTNKHTVISSFISALSASHYI